MLEAVVEVGFRQRLPGLMGLVDVLWTDLRDDRASRGSLLMEAFPDLAADQMRWCNGLKNHLSPVSNERSVNDTCHSLWSCSLTMTP